MARLWRAYLPGAAELSDGSFRLERDESHHLIKVLRLGPEDRFAVFDGAGSEWAASIVEIDRGSVVGRREERIEKPAVEPVLSIRLVQAQGRPERIDWLVQKAVEVGVAELTLLRTERVDAPPVTPRRLERWRRIAVEAAKQSGRRVVPAIDTGEDWPDPAPGVLPVLLDTDPAAPPLSRAMGDLEGAVWVACGPAAGLGEDERDQALDRGWIPAGLGPRILRSETAGVVAVTLILHRAGELG